MAFAAPCCSAAKAGDGPVGTSREVKYDLKIQRQAP
jgi:hypothetical protein